MDYSAAITQLRGVLTGYDGFWSAGLVGVGWGLQELLLFCNAD